MLNMAADRSQYGYVSSVAQGELYDEGAIAFTHVHITPKLK